jgi:hypothetical protein
MYENNLAARLQRGKRGTPKRNNVNTVDVDRRVDSWL